MATPIWFDAKAYFDNKQEQAGIADSLSLITAFKNAGYSVDADGLYKHFVEYGNAEGVSPNEWFNSNEYLYDKAVSFFGKTDVTKQEIGSMEIAMAGAGMSPWDHYQKYWSEDYAKDKSFHNASVDFDSAAYMEDKLALMQKTDAKYTMDMLVKAFNDAGFSPIMHYLLYGKAEGLTPEPVTTGTPGNTYNLTTSDDTIYGTIGDDYFFAKVGALNDADYIDGGAGDDTLYANVKPSNDDVIAPSIVNVETVLFRAQLNGDGANSGNDHTAYIDAENIVLGAKDMLTIGSDNSRTDLHIEDVRHNSDVTTVRMSNTDPGANDLKLYFNPQNLVREGSLTSGAMNVELMDVKNGDLSGEPLKENPFDTFSFQYTGADGKAEIITLKLGAVNGKATYQDLLKAFQDALEASPVKGIVTAELGAKFPGQATVGGTAYDYADGWQIQLNSANGTIAAKDPNGVNIPGTGWGVSTGVVPPTGGIVWDVTNDSNTTCPLIKTNVELDNVGRVLWDDDSACLPDDRIFGTEAGDLVIGSMAGRGGVERFDVVVDQGSWLSSMSSTNDTLRMVTVKNGIIDGISDNGNLFIGRSLLADGEVDLSSQQLANWMNLPRLLDTTGLVNVKVFDASTMEGNVNIGASLNAGALAKYMADVDGLKTMYADNAPSGDFAYSFGKGDDTLNMVVNAGIAADRDFKLNIKMGEGNDLVNFRFDELTGSRLLNQIALDNVSIDLGAGDDDAWFWGNGAVNVADGAGADNVYVGQNSEDQNAVFVFGANNLNETIIFTGPDGAQPLKNEVVSTNDVALTVTGTATANSTFNVTVTFNGIQSVVAVKLTAGQTEITMDQINKAIIEAINGDKSPLSALLVAKDGMGNSLLVESLIDGAFTAADLNVTFGAITGGGTLGNGYFTAGSNDSQLAQGSNVAEAIDSSVKVTTQGGVAAEVQELTIDTLEAGGHTIVYNGVKYTFTAVAGDETATATAMDTALNGIAGVTGAKNADGTYTFTITADAAGAKSDDTVVVKGSLGNVAGSDTGTTSDNSIFMGTGNDVIALNIGSAHNALDTLVISDLFGNDTVMNFQTGIDKIDVSDLVSGGTASKVAADVNGAGKVGITIAEAITAGSFNGFAVNEKGVVFVRNSNADNDNTYTAFKIVNDGNGPIVAGEVTVLGTLTMGTDGAFTTDDLII